MYIPLLFIGTCLVFKKKPKYIRYSKRLLIEECKRMGVSYEGTSRILRHRVNRLKGKA